MINFIFLIKKEFTHDLCENSNLFYSLKTIKCILFYLKAVGLITNLI